MTSKHGKKFQIKINKKYMKITLTGVVIVSILVFWAILKQSLYMDTEKTSYERMKSSQFVFVEDEKDVNGKGTVFDLKNRNFFSDDYAVKDNEIYGNSVLKPHNLYKEWEEFSLTNGLLYIKTTSQHIQKHGYKLEYDAKSFINQDKLSNIKSGDIESYYVYSKMTKVRISYNKDFLPVKLEGYYEKEGKMSWILLRTYSYPYRSKTEFDKSLDEQIADIREREAEEREE